MHFLYPFVHSMVFNNDLRIPRQPERGADPAILFPVISYSNLITMRRSAIQQAPVISVCHWLYLNNP